MTEAPATSYAEPQGLGGWMVLPAIGTVLAPFRYAVLLLSDYVPLFVEGGAFGKLPAGYQLYLALEVALLAALLVAWIFAIVLMFKRRRAYPVLFSTLLLTVIGFVIIDNFIAAVAFAVPFKLEDGGPIAGMVIAAGIWVPYMIYSRRVKNTFVT